MLSYIRNILMPSLLHNNPVDILVDDVLDLIDYLVELQGGPLACK
jgi:hypothetical protein